MMAAGEGCICILLNSNFKMLLNSRQGWEDVGGGKERCMDWQGNWNCYEHVRRNKLKCKKMIDIPTYASCSHITIEISSAEDSG